VPLAVIVIVRHPPASEPFHLIENRPVAVADLLLRNSTLPAVTFTRTLSPGANPLPMTLTGSALTSQTRVFSVAPAEAVPASVAAATRETMMRFKGI
jgi:hypothetical protein